ncbi:restriction endonuclease [Mesobacillus subterraneus]|uniref:restriction endonuclease n=1 Tax=Mesobacillus subterraneus TaxID=285983 RepID=UPI00203A6B99|nr:restriction endonuclease [Mesobacillus subterraneus]MCM3667153.1 restriction endonuclease [Mesobacillus subterraneus]MCM3685980.1 restriction endonuclease [Mesobacillus subterraneus]
MDLGFFEGFKMGLDLLWSMLTAEPLLTLGIIVFFGGLLIISLIVNVLREQKLRKSGILEVDKMSGRKFEEYLQALLKTKGYYVQLTPASGDYGADLILSTKDMKIIVQAKRYKKNVGVKAVQEIASAKSHYKADECWVVTNSFFTEQARKLASSNQVRLVDRKQLMDWMLKDNKGVL